LYIPVEIFTFGFDIGHAITSLPLPLFTSGLLLSCTHGERLEYEKREEKKVVDKTKHRGVAECKKKKKKRGRRRRLFFFGAKKARTTGKSLLP
jgi:hypothetical protein